MTRTKVFVGYVHPDTVPHAFIEALFTQMLDKELQLQVKPISSGPLIAQGRNKILHHFLASDYEYLLMVDTDIIWMPADLHRLLAHKRDIVSGVYLSRKENDVIWPVFLRKKKGSFVKADIKDVRGKTKLLRVDAIGMGFCLMSRKLVEDLGIENLWPFAEILNPVTGSSMGEDVTFCLRVAEKGYTIYVDPMVRVGHIKSVIFRDPEFTGEAV